MTILASLNNAYYRLAKRDKVPAFGFSTEKVSFVISLNSDGSIAGPPRDIRDTSGKKPTPKLLPLPQPAKRSSGIKPNFLWDKTSYVLGITAGSGNRTQEEHKAFIDFHNTALKDTQDKGLKAFLLFLQKWKPDEFEKLNWPEEIKTNIKDQNVIFALESERLEDDYLHNHSAARQIWADLASEGEKTQAICLVTGKKAPIARLHPSIKGVRGGQSSGASIVSFNLDAFTSYNHEQGENAPVSEAATFAYTTALNKFLEKGSVNRIQLGDASTVFWADAANAEAAAITEDIFPYLLDVNETAEAKNKILPILDSIRKGEPLIETNPDLSKDVRFYILGLAPNAARISIRFWFEDTFGVLIKNYQKFLDNMHIEPPDMDNNLSLWKYLREIAVLGKSENVPPNLSGEWTRSILTGKRYPQTLLTNVLMRIRSDKNVNSRRVSILKSVLIRNLKSKEAPVALDPENKNKGYLLGRLFAIYERIQYAALGDKVNATIKDKFYGSAASQPRKVFALLDKGSANHLSKIGKHKTGYKITLEKQVGEIFDLMSPSKDPFPTALSSEEQALFALGYYHQRSEFFKTKSTDVTPQ
ncbi:MAG: type I-C CRISPR-associated protein Cas8c/Csd1 [Alphaproteobacteria bacterium]|nr:type I-C CRISPR-associated protein Cas8c/Csd1 [Alphaproteobacteria bacterium]